MILWWKGEMSPLQPLNIENITHAKWLIELHSLATGREDSYRIKNNDIKDENWEVYNWLWKNHAYSLERKYQNKDGYWHFIVVNPHDTSKKIDMTEKQLMKTFQSFSSYTVDINQLFIE
jgi:sarcosine oxidase delta subunit